MARATAIQTSFNGGELSPRMAGRVDQQVYVNGCDRMLGWFGTLQGPAVAMPGTRFVAAAKGPCRLIPFEYNVTQSYAIEAGEGYFRFFTNDVQIESAPGVPYELATPWSLAQVRELDFAQSLDVLYLTHPDVAPYELRRLTGTTFALVKLALAGGPFDTGNTDEAVTIWSSADLGAVTLTANVAGFFTAGDIGSLFQLEAGDYNLTPAWEPGISVNAGQDKASDGKVYNAQTTGRTGSVQPTHARGAEYDGMVNGTDLNGKPAGGVLWTYVHDRFGIVRIDSVAGDGLTAQCTVVRRLPTGFDVPSYRWARAAFSIRSGWPEAVTIWNERLVLAKGATLYGSVVGGYDDFSARDTAGDFQRDQAFIAQLPNPNRIRWLAADRTLLIGTARAEHVAEQLQISTGTPGPPVIQVSTQSTYGSRQTRPVLADGRVLFIQRAGRKILELGYAIATDRYEAPDMTRLADHIGVAGFTELAWVQEPERTLWAVRGDGTLAAMTYSPSQQVMGWSPRELGGGIAARSACAITDPAGDRDQLWIAAQAGAAWWILRQMPLREDGDAIAASFYVDAGLSHVGLPISSGNGLAHLAGRQAAVLADGKPLPPITIGAGGEWAIDAPASVIHIGLAYPAVLRVMQPEAGGERGTAQGKTKRVPQVTLRLRQAGGLNVAVQGLPARPVETRTAGDAMDAATPLFSGDWKMDTGGEFEPGGRITITRTLPLPAMLCAAMYELEVAA